MLVPPTTALLALCGLLAGSAAASTLQPPEGPDTLPLSTPATQPQPGPESPATATEPPPTTAPALTGPVWLRVTGEDVNLHSRPDRNSISVMQVPRDTSLRAFERQYNWYRIEPPEGAFSYVAARYIEPSGEDAGTVNVSSGNLRVRVGSVLQSVDPASSDVQMLLPRGATVRILEREGEWLRIAPPEGVSLYVHTDYAEPVPADVAARLRSARQARERPADVGEQKSAAAAPDLSGTWGQRLALVETQIQAEARHPALDQDWAAILAQLRPIADQREEPAVGRLAAAWMPQIEQRIAAQAALAAAQELARAEQFDRTQFEREREQARRAAAAATQPGFAAVGQLRLSYALGGSAQQPRYKLEDPLTRELVAYVDFGPNAPHAAAYVGFYVGIDGQRRVDSQLAVPVISVERIEKLIPPPMHAPSVRRTP